MQKQYDKSNEYGVKYREINHKYNGTNYKAHEYESGMIEIPSIKVIIHQQQE